MCMLNELKMKSLHKTLDSFIETFSMFKKKKEEQFCYKRWKRRESIRIFGYTKKQHKTERQNPSDTKSICSLCWERLTQTLSRAPAYAPQLYSCSVLYNAT